MTDEDKPSLADCMEAAKVWDGEIEQFEKNIEQARAKRSKILEELVSFYGKSFEFGGKWYSIKKIKKTGIHFAVEYDKEPGSWARKKEDPSEDEESLENSNDK